MSTKIKKGTFHSTAVDIIDHNQSLATATTSFHGTSKTIFQHTDHHMQNEPIQYDMNDSITTKTQSYLITSSILSLLREVNLSHMLC